MAKTTMFKKIARLMRMAHEANRQNLSNSELREKIEFGKDQYNRRKFIRDAAAASAGVVIAAKFGVPRAFGQSEDKSETVVVLGAGAAGLAAAYRLKKAGVPYLLVDASTRVGGRIMTGRNFNGDGQFVEIGAELVDTPHYVLRALAKELNVEVEDFAPQDEGLDDDVFYINNTVYSHSQFVEAVRPLTKKMADAYADMFEGGNPDTDELSYRTCDPTSPGYKLKNARKYDQMTIRGFLDQNKDGVEPWVVSAIDHAYIGEYGLETDQQSSINLLYLLNTEATDNCAIFGPSDEVSRIKGGNDTLVKALENALDKRRIILGQKLVRISTDSDGLIELEFDNYKGKTVVAKQVICTIPFSVLGNVEGLSQLNLSPRKKQAIGNFIMGNNAKLFLTFKDRSWREKDAATGFVPGTKNVRPSRGALFMDTKSQAFWETSRLQNGKRGILTNFLGGNSGLNSSDATVATALADLNKLYPGISGKFEARTADIDPRIPGVKQCMNWNKNPLTKGSYACLRPGQWTTFWGSCGEPETLLDDKRPRLFFAGEHTSMNFQGFMEGGYESGTRAAEELIASRTGEDVADHYVWAKQILGITDAAPSAPPAAAVGGDKR